MFPYWILFGVCAFGAIIGGRRDDARKFDFLLWFVAACIALMIGLRLQVGADWYNYLRIFQRTSEVAFTRSLGEGDPAFQMINWVISNLDGSIWAVNLICGIIFCLGLARFCQSQPYPWIALTVAVPYMVIVVAMGYTRQGAALGIILAGLADFLRRESVFRLAIYVAFAATFHATSVVVFLLVAFSGHRSRFVIVLGSVAATILLYSLFLAPSMERFYGIYMKTGYSSQGALIRVLMDVSAACVFLAIGRKLAFDVTEKRMWRNFAFASFAALLALAISPSSTAVDRVAIYLLPLQIAVFGRLPILAPHNAVIRLAPIVLFGVIQFVWFNFAQFSKLWLPYKAFWF